MKQNLVKLFVWCICFELILAPMPAMSVSTGNQTPAPDDAGARFLNVTGTLLQNTILGNNAQTGPSPQFQANQSKFVEMQTPIPDKYFNSQKLLSIPGLGNYLALNNINPALLNCSTLKSSATDFKIEACESGRIAPNNPGLDFEVINYAQQFDKISKVYENYLTTSNTDGQLFGVGCMKNAMQILKGFFDYKINELDKMSSKMEAITNNFKEASLADLNAIKESTAVLDGGDNDLVNEVRTKNPDLFDFGKRFNNPACNSMFDSNQEITEKGRSGGLNSINQDLIAKYNDKGNGKFSGKSYEANHSMMVQDLQNMSDKVAKQIQLNFADIANDPKGSGYLKFLQTLPATISSTQGADRALRADLFSDLQTKFQDQNDKLSADETDVKNELRAAGVDPTRATTLLTSRNDANFQTEVRSIENQIKNRCIQRTVDVDTVISKMVDPTASKFANQNASSFMKEKLRKIMANSSSSPTQKLNELQSLQNGGQQGNFQLLRQNSYEKKSVDTNGNLISTEVKANATVSPSQFIIDQIQSCESDFRATNLGNKFSGSEVTSKLTSLNQSYKNLRDSHASEVKKMLQDRLINCSTSEQASSTTPGSCSSEKFNPATSGFCAAGALSCSRNMKQCSDQAANFVKQIKTERTARLTNYKGMVEKNKNDIVKLFDNVMTSYSRDAESMRGMFGVGFTAPAGIEREVPEGNRFLGNFANATSKSPDGKMLLEDPDKYLSMFKENIDKLKASVKEQQDQILGGSAESPRGILAKHVSDPTEKNLRAVQAKYKQMTDKCIAAHNNFTNAQEQMSKDQNMKNSEMGEKLNKYCNLYSDAMSDHPNGACKKDANELANDALKAVQALNLGSTIEVENTRNEINSVCGEFTDSRAGGGETTNPQVGDLCFDPDAPDKLQDFFSKQGKSPLGKDETIQKLCDSYRNCAGTHLADSDQIHDETNRPKQVAVSNCALPEKKLTGLLGAYNKKSREPLIVKEKPSHSTDIPHFCSGNNNTQFNPKSIFDGMGQGLINGTANPLGQRQ